jgi:SAM-dependent methyltransferase
VPSLERLVRLLEQVEFLRSTDAGVLVLSQIGEMARRAHPLGLYSALGLADTELRAWVELTHCVRTGESGFFHSYGVSHRSYRALHPEEDRRMDEVHQVATRLDSLTLLRQYPWGSSSSLVDVGGGTGTFLSAILRRYPHATGVLFDLPCMVARAIPEVSELERLGRCRVVGGSFFEAEDLPLGAHTYILKAVLGGWNDDDATKILSVIRRNVRPGARVLILEPMLNHGCGVGRGDSVQLYSLALYGGRLRSADDYRSLAKTSGFAVTAVIPRQTLSIIELTPDDAVHREHPPDPLT